MSDRYERVQVESRAELRRRPAKNRAEGKRPRSPSEPARSDLLRDVRTHAPVTDRTSGTPSAGASWRR
jgi:hypothetical protein